LGAGLTIQPCKKVIVTIPQQERALEPYDDDDRFGRKLGTLQTWWRRDNPVSGLSSLRTVASLIYPSSYDVRYLLLNRCTDKMESNITVNI
jgi:hypothetical protein